MSAADTFASLKAALAADPTLGKKIKGVLCFELGGDNVWSVDCANGEVSQSKPEKADCTVTMSEEDFVKLAAGELNGMRAYMMGKMKIVGKAALAQKFGDLAAAARKAPKQAAAAPAPAPSPSPSPTASAAAPAGFASNVIFARIAANLAANPALLDKVDGTFLFKLSGGPGGASAAWAVDAKKGGTGGVTPSEDAVAKPDCTISISDADFVKLATGKLAPMSAYMSGKLKLSGKASLAQKLGPLFKESKPRAKL